MEKKKKTSRTSKTVNTGDYQQMMGQLKAGYALQSDARKGDFDKKKNRAGMDLVRKGGKTFNKLASKITKKK